MEFNFTVRGDRIESDKDYSFTEGNKGSYVAKFDFGEEWQGFVKICIFENEGDCLPVAIINNCAELPLVERLSAKIGVIGVEALADEKYAVRISTNMKAIGVNSGAASSKAIAKLEKAAEVWEKYLADMENNRKAAENAALEAANKAKKELETAETNAKKYATDAKASADNAAESEESAKASEVAAEKSKTDTADLTSRAETAAENAEESEQNASASQKSASQALSDLLSMINSGDIILATDGKLPLSAIPATATQEIYVVESEDQLTSLTAQRGDLAELVEEIDGEKTITKTWQCLGDASLHDSWVVWGTSYAVQAGNSTTANNAQNANMINNHRIVEMTEEEFASAVKDEDTYYLVY